jgi:uncharacterized protein (TIGR02145 family)
MKSINFALLIVPFASMINLQAQDYLISFAGTGASATVDSVKIENLTQGTKLKMKGSDVLHLMGTTGIETIMGDEDGKITFYPNPMKDNARMQFVLPVSGETLITLYEISGKKIAQTRDFLIKGQHTYRLQGIEEGIYFVMINAGKYFCTGRLISSASNGSAFNIIYENIVALQEKQNDSKGTNEEKVMQYTTGDRLKFTSFSYNYSTIMTDIPVASTTITFDFIPCVFGGDFYNYPIVKIGEKTWMAENLRTTKLNDGTPIQNVTDNTSWSGNTPAYCWYNNIEAGYKDAYGALYNWYSVNTGKLCPAGWHVPTDLEWTNLTNYLGGVTVAGGKMKEVRAYWTGPNTGATNESGFTGLPGGFRQWNGTFALAGNDGFWWSATETDDHYSAWKFYLDYTSYQSFRSSDVKAQGYSVRCLKD